MTVLSNESSLQVAMIDAPAMYADHHVVEVRRLLLGLPGVTQVYASSCFKIVEVSYDPSRISEEAITACLNEAGYLGDLPVPEETGSAAAREKGEKAFFRHTEMYEHARQAVSFGQEVIHSGRPLWPCPGMGVIKNNLITPGVIKKMEE
jgi:copper chaperone CopZ